LIAVQLRSGYMFPDRDQAPIFNMGFFNTPHKAALPQEIDRAISRWQSDHHIPHDLAEVTRTWFHAAGSDKHENIQWKGLNIDELSDSMSGFKTIVKDSHSSYLHSLGDLESNLKDAIEQTNYGKTLPF